jgi:hypothetical protein
LATTISAQFLFSRRAFMLKRYGPLIIFVAGASLIVAGLAYSRFTQAIANPGIAPVPESIVGLPRIRVNYGSVAIAEVTQMHGQEFPLSSGAAATYGQPGSSVTLWVTGTPARLLSIRMVAQMEDAIASAESPFTPLGVRQIDGRAVYELTGMGQRHIYFRSADLVVWLAADEVIAEAALAETLGFYP